MTRDALNTLLDIIKPPGHPALPKQKGVSGACPPDAQLGLLLFYVGSTMAMEHLCLLFGITPSVCSQIRNNMLKLVLRKLRHLPMAKVQFPDEEKNAEICPVSMYL